MPKKLPLVLAALAFVLAIGAGLLFWRLNFHGVVVLRLRHPVPAFAPLVASDMDPITIPAAAAPPDALHSLPEGRFAATALPAGETLLPQHVRTAPESPLEKALGPDERLMSIPIDPTRTLAGDLHPGDRVSVLAVPARPDSKTPAPPPELLMDHVLVAGLRTKIGTHLDKAEAAGISEPGAVVLRLSLDQASRLAAAVRDGQTVYLLLQARGEGA